MQGPQVFETTPIEVEAMLFDNDNAQAVLEWVAANTQGLFAPEAVAASGSGVSIDPSDGFMVIASNRGTFKPSPGDFIIKVPGMVGQFTKMPYTYFVQAHRTIGDDIMPGLPTPIDLTDHSESPQGQENGDASPMDTQEG